LKGRKFRHPNWPGGFKKGDPSPRARNLGDVRATKDGYVEVCIDRPNRKTGYKYSWARKHRWVWEQQNGEIPTGMILICKSDDKSNSDPSNWELIRASAIPALCMRRGYNSASAELKPTILAVTKLEYSLRQMAKGNR
jgi:hypothetical protein